MNYRSDARTHLTDAIEELAVGEDRRLKYAALELRMAMEAVTYDRALAYKDELPPAEYAIWQPKKVMFALLELDPNADKDSVLAVGIEEEPGISSKDMQGLGAEKVLGMAELRKHYDALGSYLHVPTLKQSMSGAHPDVAKLRSRCDEIVKFVEAVLGSTVYNITLGQFAALDCQECGKMLRKRMPPGQATVKMECFECPASYTAADIGGGKVECKPDQLEIACGNGQCGKKIVVWQRELQTGMGWTCPGCQGRNVFALAVRHEASGGSGSDVSVGGH